MKKTFVISVVAIILFIVISFFAINTFIYNEKQGEVALKNEHDGAYKIDGQNIFLENGISEMEAAPGSASKIITKYWGGDLKADFDNNGKEDVAFIISQSTGGSGTFYYVVARMNGESSVDAVLLGDRIAPQNINYDNGIILVNYADRKAGESFAVSPSVGKTLRLKIDFKTMQFGEVAENFEGEADPKKMSLEMKTWSWVNAKYNDGKEVKPKTNRFTLTFKDDKTFSATTDCNGIGGEYVVKGNKISFSKMISTMMYCDGSQESDFSKLLTDSDNFLFTSKGELVLGLKYGSGSVIFR
jgi:heat shock protein HslJ